MAAPLDQPMGLIFVVVAITVIARIASRRFVLTLGLFVEVLSMVVLLLAMPGCQRWTRPGEEAFDEGTRAYLAGRYDAAATAFATAARALEGDEDRGRALHNLGNALAQAGRDPEALDAWRASLRLGDRESTRTNYEIVRARAPPPPAPAPPRAASDDERLFDAARQLVVPPPAARRSSPERRIVDW